MATAKVLTDPVAIAAALRDAGIQILERTTTEAEDADDVMVIGWTMVILILVLLLGIVIFGVRFIAKDIKKNHRPTPKKILNSPAYDFKELIYGLDAQNNRTAEEIAKLKKWFERVEIVDDFETGEQRVTLIRDTPGW